MGTDRRQHQGSRESQELELYLHIPFCIRKCFYCDFLSEQGSPEQIADYVNWLCREIKAWGQVLKGEGTYRISSIFIGGGTPSCLNGEQIARLGDILQSSFSVEEEAEITIEANPGTIQPDTVKSWRRIGINRISLGLQSAQDRELKRLGRIHNWQQFLESFRLVREEGFGNINIDLMAGIPEQTGASYRDTLQKVTELEPEHISSYSLIVEPGTPFYQWQEEGRLEVVSEETDREMYQFTKQFLQDRGYRRYEISNYAREGKECRHNIGYWRGTQYLGLGLGASSFLGNYRFSNPREMAVYCRYIEELSHGRDFRELSLLDPEWEEEERRMEEFMFLGLRMQDGVSAKEFYGLFGRNMSEVYGDVISALKKKKLLAEDSFHDRIYLTDHGIDLSNIVLAEFLLD